MNEGLQIFAIGLPAGLAAGGLYFAAVWRSARRLSAEPRLGRWWIAASARFLALAGVLALIARQAPLALVGVLPGLVLARAMAIHLAGPARPPDAARRGHPHPDARAHPGGPLRPVKQEDARDHHSAESSQ